MRSPQHPVCGFHNGGGQYLEITRKILDCVSELQVPSTSISWGWAVPESDSSADEWVEPVVERDLRQGDVWQDQVGTIIEYVALVEVGSGEIGEAPPPKDDEPAANVGGGAGGAEPEPLQRIPGRLMPQPLSGRSDIGC
ncbi:unnamed protein product [Cyclocybe aegerita]|uniref:Uncharacterized protein n=1 Tax=Cyclocybe aegerita TaxID=1973307 RepID=A0A8S0XJQ2_CYCAE|nr:unnamed protein product [Cyclocybe aegerita]